MKKFAKMSLVAAIAVAGMTSASAASLEEAIKNTDVSGKVYVEFTSDNSDTNDTTTNATDIDVDITFKSKVNDNITSVVRVQADGGDTENGIAASQAVTVDNVYFTYVNGALTAMVGKQDINTPNTDGEIGNGIVASYTAGPVTVAGMHFIENAITTDEISGLAAIATLGPVNAELWYVNVTGQSQNITGVVSGAIGPVTAKLRYANSDFDAAGVDDGNTLRVDIGAKFAGLGLTATYLTTDKDGAAVVTDPSSANTYELSQLGADSALADVDVWAVSANYTMDKMYYEIAYANLDQDDDQAGYVESDEIRLRAKYSMSSNFAIMGTYSIYEKDVSGTETVDNDSARLEAKYSF